MTNDYVQEYQKVLFEQEPWNKQFFRVNANQKATAIMTYLLKDLLSYQSFDEAKPHLDAEFVEKYCLQPIVALHPVPEMLPGEFYCLAWYVWPEKKPSADDLTRKVYRDVLDGRRRTFPSKYFIRVPDPGHTAVVCFRYLCEDVLHLQNEDEILKTFGHSSGIKVLGQYKLKIVLNVVFPSLSHLLYAAYPDINEKQKGGK